MSKLDDIFDANTKAITAYVDNHGHKVTDLDIVLVDVSIAKHQIKDFLLELIEEDETKPTGVVAGSTARNNLRSELRQRVDAL